ncbi:MAG: hypothetical protein CR967_04330 [Proteobacteria bacterium]|nr:MAG: hypothetical protein CR967_04330 [Pseudomonadota bacterium]
MGLDLLLLIGFGVFIVLMFIIIYFKDLESSKKFQRFERAIEDLNHQNHQLKQDLEEKGGVNIEAQLKEKILPLFDSVKNMETTIAKIANHQDQQVLRLEEKIKNATFISSPLSSNAQGIIYLYQNGRRIDEIAREFQIGIEEVESTLKMHNLL